ncbi:MAG: hypothetical protein KGJ60_15415, partial [Verrucomicrobiota bacterium]|nr:hypothetical protein [Verrucomicrobiota bacterium]
RLFHGDPGTDVPEINERFLGHGNSPFKVQGSSLCGSGIEPRLMGNHTMPERTGRCGKLARELT